MFKLSHLFCLINDTIDLFMIRKLPRTISFSVVSALLFVVPLFLLRVTFWKLFDNPADSISFGTLIRSLYIGFKFDLRLSLLIILPFILIGWLRPVNPFKFRFARILWVIYFTIIAFIVFLFYIVDFGHFAYLHVRLDSTAISLLEDAAISFQMVWETYPVIWMSLGLLSVSALYCYGVNRLILLFARVSSSQMKRWQTAIVVSLYIFLIIFGIYGKLSYYPLRWSDAFYGTNAFASSVALNPVLYFYDTINAGGIRYDKNIIREHYFEIADYLGVSSKDREKLNFTRYIKPDGGIKGRPNVVMVFLESFSYYKTGLYGNPLNPTTNFDAIAKEGLLFTKFYTPHWGTARSIFTAVTGIPDVETNNTSSRNPSIVCQHTIINAFEGYEKFFFIGGSASWGNIRGLLSHNVPGIRIYEEGSYQSPRVDVWGISDLALFEEANNVLGQVQDKPYFAIIQTAGNHRPYTIPEDSRGFKPESPDLEILKRNGYESVEEFNAFRFLDHSVGVFMDMARKEKYFDNTIFVFFGDHGIRGDGGDHTPKYETQLGLTGFHVPFLIYAPKLIRGGQTYDSIASEMDVLPTIASLTSHEYMNKTMGRNLLDPGIESRHYGFTIVHRSIPEIGLFNEKFYLLMSENGSNKHLHRLDSESPQDDVLEKYPEDVKNMERILRGFHETSKYMLYYNSCS